MAVADSTRLREDVVVLDDCRVLKNPGSALWVESEVILELTGGKTTKEWIPISQIDDESELWGAHKPGSEGDLVISLWIAEKKGLA